MSPDPAAVPSPARRVFHSRLTLGLVGLGAAVAAIPAVAFVLGPLLRRVPSVWRDVGPVSRFAIGDTVEVVFEDPSPAPWAGVSALTGAWLRRNTADRFTAFSIHCTHLGCPVRWVDSAELFMCPCHGGVYYRDGRVAAGPPPVPLQHHPVRVQNGRVQIRTQPIPIT
jgi:menaquinol-cytochrome c reductase iron-sulfur subunit